MIYYLQSFAQVCFLANDDGTVEAQKVSDTDGLVKEWNGRKFKSKDEAEKAIISFIKKNNTNW